MLVLDLLQLLLDELGLFPLLVVVHLAAVVSPPLVVSVWRLDSLDRWVLGRLSRLVEDLVLASPLLGSRLLFLFLSLWIGYILNLQVGLVYIWRRVSLLQVRLGYLAKLLAFQGLVPAWH